MIDSTIPLHDSTPSAIRAERRRIVESVQAHRRLLAKRRAFEASDRQRLNREARERDRAEARHGKALQRIHEKQVKGERSLTGKLNGLDGKRDSQERRALAVLRRESIDQSLRSTHLTASQVNGIGSGLVRDLAAQGVRTAADFRRVSWGKAPNGKGGEVLYIHRTQGRKVHINGIGEHRGRPLMEWRQSALARAESRAPDELPADQRHRIAEIIENERVRLQAELDEAPKLAATARAEAVGVHTEALERLAVAEGEAAEEAARRRAEFDAMAERLLGLQAELSAHVDRFGDLGLRDRRSRSRAFRPLPAAPAVPAPRAPEADSRSEARPASATSGAAAAAPDATALDGVRASLGWLVPMVFFGMTTVLGTGDDATDPLWFRITARLAALAMLADLLRLWVPRRRWRTAGSLPAGTGLLASGVFLGLLSASMFVDPEHSAGGAPWAVAVVSALLLLGGAARRAGTRTPGPTAD
ncbi:hypothetical protein AB0A76_17125 [Streptomyces exfoliatus]|uniref:Uncharacterized protein n=1 Tax=Streptomyces exfoliatus TaxID=1905 RepID=A0ABV3CZP4_STREX